MKCLECSAEMVKAGKFLFCGECGHRLEDTGQAYSEFDRKVIGGYHIFIALPYKRMIDKAEPVVKLSKAEDIHRCFHKHPQVPRIDRADRRPQIRLQKREGQ